MCRFLAYKGKPAIIADLVTHPQNSLIRQSYAAKEMNHNPVNGDGFGLGWYSPEIDPTPGLYTSLNPAWANKNLHRLAARIKSPCFFAHVRAATEGVVSEENCHPFKFGDLLWMHNGSVKEFSKIKRVLRRSLRDDIYNWILGTTDSEHAFAVFLNQFPIEKKEFTAQDLKDGMRKTISQLKTWLEEAGVEPAAVCNFVVSDGKKILASRYKSKENGKYATLYYSSGDYACEDGVCEIKNAGKDFSADLIASEPLTTREDWVEVPKNHFVLIDEDNSISLEPV